MNVNQSEVKQNHKESKCRSGVLHAEYTKWNAPYGYIVSLIYFESKFDKMGLN